MAPACCVSTTPTRKHLDEFGSFVWLSIDGKNTVFDIGGKVKEEFGEEAEPLYPRLIQFLNVLKEVKYIEFL